MNNPGKYDDLCTLAREAAQADGAILIVINGKNGSGFSVQAPPGLLSQLPGTLVYMADQIQKDLFKKGLA